MLIVNGHRVKIVAESPTLNQGPNRRQLPWMTVIKVYDEAGERLGSVVEYSRRRLGPPAETMAVAFVGGRPFMSIIGGTVNDVVAEIYGH